MMENNHLKNELGQCERIKNNQINYLQQELAKFTKKMENFNA